MHQSLRLLVVVLAVWRVTHLVAHEDGPWAILRRTRAALSRVPGGRLLSCFYCLSVWTAAPGGWYVGETLTERLVCWAAVSGAAILLERATTRSGGLIVEEHGDELLRSTGRTGDDHPV